MSQTFCPECGGAMTYETSTKRYICTSCGLYLTKEEISDLKEKRREELSEKRKKKQERDEYLEWWLSKKK